MHFRMHIDRLEDTKGSYECSQREEDEDLEGQHDWTWDAASQSPGVVLVQFNTQIMFHPTYSSGTASIFGTKALESPHHHYWEVKMLSKVYGTDVMVGLATKAINTSSFIHSFGSLLGHDNNSWGFSYQGFVQHANRKVSYGERWTTGSTVGVHYDSWRGSVEFYLDRRPLGIAFTGLADKVLYPIVCSTAAKSEMKLITAQSFPNNLQFSSLKALANKIPGSNILNLCLPPGLRNFIKNNYWFFINMQEDKKQFQIISDSPPWTSNNSRDLKKASSPVYSSKRTVDERDSESDDDDCFLNLRSKKLALMKKCRERIGKSTSMAMSPMSQNTPCHSQDYVLSKSTTVSPGPPLSEDDEVCSATPQKRKRFVLMRKK